MQKQPVLNEVARHILSSTELLMARDGLQNLSMHKIAKEAGLASGTLYLYFKNKDDLLNRLAYDLYERFCSTAYTCLDLTLPLQEQYAQLWQCKWAFLQDNPTVAVNLYQYRALSGLQQIIGECFSDPQETWNLFVKRGQDAGVIAQLPSEVLFSLSLGVALDLAHLQAVGLAQFSAKTLEDVMHRTWKAMTF